MLVCGLDAFLGISAQDVLASHLEGLWDWGRSGIHQILDRVRHLGPLLGVLQKLVLEGLSKDLGKLSSGVGWVSAKNHAWISVQEI